jgi:hypothetical protein
MKNNLNKKVGVWLDHSKAYFVDFSKGPAVIETVYSDKETQMRFGGEHGNGTQMGKHRSTNNEHHQHNREQEHMHEYYHILADRLKNYDDIFLFGSTTAKDELYNNLKDDKHFAEKSITVKPADHLTENQMVAEAKKFFNL